MYTMRRQHFLLWAADQNWVRIEKTDSGGLWSNLQKELLKIHHFTFSRAEKGEISTAVPVCACIFFFLMSLGNGSHWGQHIDCEHLSLILQPAQSEPQEWLIDRHWQFSFKEIFLFKGHLRTIWDMFQHSWLLSLPILCHRRVYLF